MLPACVGLLPAAQNAAPAAAEQPKGRPADPSEYILGPEDQINIQTLHADEIANKPLRIDMNGDVTVPMIGRVHAGGRSLREVEADVNERLAEFIRQPLASVTVTEFRSQPVSVLGAVNSPGIHQVQGRKTVAEMLSLAGGLRPDAGYRLTLTRKLTWGKIPAANTVIDPSGSSSTAEFKLNDILRDNGDVGNLLVMPHDIISVPKAEMVYVIGDVRRSGGFVLGEKETVSVLQALSLAEGWERTAAPQNARIIRPSKSGPSEETAIDIRKVLKGSAPDFPLRGEDILFVPGSTGKRAALRALEAALQTGSGVAIWRSGR
jgi:polysaccharide export outer membrane protein